MEKARSYLSELIGTFLLVFFGTGAITVARGNTLTIGLAFGLAITVSIYAFGTLSGGHFNPAVSTAMAIEKKISWGDFLGYIIFQIVGAILASLCILKFVNDLGLQSSQLGQTDFSNVSTGTAFFAEALATFLFVTIILNVTSKHGDNRLAGLTIGLALAFLIIVLLNITGGSLNPARSIGPAVFAGGSSLSHLWLYIVAPEVGGIIAAYCNRYLMAT